MAHIPTSYIDRVWNETTDKSWGGYCATLEGYKAKSWEFKPELIEEMLSYCREYMSAGRPFPGSVTELYEMFHAAVPAGV